MKDRLGNEVPEHAVAFAEWVSARGWNYLREWIPAWEDEDGWHEGFWSQTIWHEKPAAYPREEGIWTFWMEVSDSIIRFDGAWDDYLKFAEMCSENERISCRVPFMHQQDPVARCTEAFVTTPRIE